MPFTCSLNSLNQSAYHHSRTLWLLVLGAIWLIVNSRFVPWSTLDYPLGLMTLIAGSIWQLLPPDDAYQELDDNDDFCLKDTLYSVTIATVITMVVLHIMDC